MSWAKSEFFTVANDIVQKELYLKHHVVVSNSSNEYSSMIHV